MTVFIDTSAFYAFLDSKDEFYSKAHRIFERFVTEEQEMVTSNYVVLETAALLQARIGLKPIKAFKENMLPMIQITWISEQIHETCLSVLLANDLREISLVDYTSFAVMRSLGIQKTFTFDRHFAKQGFTLVT